MAFEQDLRAYLEKREHSSSSYVSWRRRIDVSELHRHLLDRLRVIERSSERGAIEQLFEEWSSKLQRFVRYMEMLPRSLAPVDRRDTMIFARRALDAALGYAEPNDPLVDRLEMKRLVAEFLEEDSKIERYALENRLVRGSSRRRPRVTEMGRVFLQLRGKDALRWLATGEVLQSSGPSDPWHVSAEILERALDRHGLPSEAGYNGETLNRLIELGLLEAVLDERGSHLVHYRVAASIRDVVQAVCDPGPWHTAIQALFDDERAEILPESSSGAADATIEQTKLIVHEVRNALVPVRHDIDALRSLVLEPAHRQRIDTARQGVVRLLDFVEEMAQMSELITEPWSRCEISAVVDDALGWTDHARRVERPLSPSGLHILAPRTRLARAISNVVGNALQATTAGQLVRVAIEKTIGFVRVTVDDGGPGIPGEYRRRVFLEGVTMRKDGGGSGFGLAFAQRFVEGTLHGRIWCEDSDLGGARFVIELPEPSEP